MRCKCGRDAWPNQQVCPECLKNWTEMRKKAFEFIEQKHGKMTAVNHPIFKKEIKRLEKLWRKDPGKFETELQWEDE